MSFSLAAVRSRTSRSQSWTLPSSTACTSRSTHSGTCSRSSASPSRRASSYSTTCCPARSRSANRKRTTIAWTGDVYKAAEALRRLCPDLLVLEVDTNPTGTCVVLFPDARRGGVLQGYDEWVAIEAVRPRPPAGARRRARAHPSARP